MLIVFLITDSRRKNIVRNLRIRYFGITALVLRLKFPCVKNVLLYALVALVLIFINTKTLARKVFTDFWNYCRFIIYYKRIDLKKYIFY
jgi:hypothetical protein